MTIAASTNAPPVQQKETPSLLNVPATKDEWFEAINEVVNEFYAESSSKPIATKVWGLLCDAPPHGYGITAGRDKHGKICLIMAGKTLNKRALMARLERYGIK